MLANADALVVGRVIAVHGVRGWVKVYSHTWPLENIFDYQPWYLRGEQGWEPVELGAGKRHGKGLIARLDDCDDRDRALEQYVGRDIAVPRQALPEPEPGEYYWRDLIDLRVLLVDGREIGRVRELLETGANDVLVVQGEAGSLDRRERLIPWIPEQVVTAVDLDGGTLTVDWDPDF